MSIDPKYIDVTGLPPGIASGGVLPESLPHGKRGFEMYGARANVYPRSQWRDMIEASSGARDYVRKIKDQIGGSCVSNATTQAFEVSWNRALGLDRWIEMSAMSLYKRCGSSPNSGSMLSTNLREMRDVGALPIDNSDNRARLQEMGLPSGDVFPHSNFYTPYPSSNWKQTAKHFRFQEVVEAGGFDEIASALLDNRPVVFARASHCIVGVQLVYENGVYSVRYANSWGNWGDNGYGYDTESYFKRSGAAQWTFIPLDPHIPDSEVANVPTPAE